MIKLFSLKNQAKNQQGQGQTNNNANKTVRTTPAQIRITKGISILSAVLSSIQSISYHFISFLDIQDLHLPRNCSMVNEGDDLLNFKIIIGPDEVS